MTHHTQYLILAGIITIGIILYLIFSRKKFLKTQKTIEDQLIHQYEIATELSQISTEFINLPLNELDDKVPLALEKIGSIIGIQQVAIFLNNENGDKDILKLKYRWQLDGAKPVFPKSIKLNSKLYPWLNHLYLKGEEIIILHPNDFPEIAIREKQIFASTEWHCAVLIPLKIGGDFIGYILFSNYDSNLSCPLIQAGNMRLVAEILMNAFDRKQKRVNLRELRRDSLKAQDKERDRIARELHDQLGSILSGLKLQADNLCSEVIDRDHNIAEYAHRISEITADLIPRVRKICSEMSPLILKDMTLPNALEWQVIEFRKHTSLNVIFDFGFKDEFTPDKMRDTALYRIVQELLTNVLRHSNATKVFLSLDLSIDNKIILELQDNGKGFKESILQGKQSHFGLRSIRERVELLEGELIYGNRIKGGAFTRIIIPEANY